MVVGHRLGDWAFVAASVLLAAGVAAASDPDSISLAGIQLVPALEELTLTTADPSVGYDITLRNTTEQPMSFELSAVDLTDNPELVGRLLPGSSDPQLTDAYRLMKWLTYEKPVVMLDPGETESVRVSVQNQVSLSPGGHYAAIVFQQQTANELADSATVSVRQQIYSLLFVKKIGGEQIELSLRSVVPERRGINLPTATVLRFQNSGNVHVIPRGRVRLVDPLERSVAEGLLNIDSSVILPGSFREYRVILRPVALAWLPGRYRIVVDYRHDQTEEFWRFISRFFAVTGHVQIAVVAIIAVGVGVVVSAVQRRIRR